MTGFWTWIMIFSLFMIFTIIVEVLSLRKVKNKKSKVIVLMATICQLALCIYNILAALIPAARLLVGLLELVICLVVIAAYLSGGYLKAFDGGVYALFISLLFVFTFWISIAIGIQFGQFTHEVETAYIISIEDGVQTINVTDNPDAKEEVEKRLAEEREYSYVYDEGVVIVTYNCNIPIIRKNEHIKNCKCSKTEICDFCKEHVEKAEAKIKYEKVFIAK